MKSAKNIIPKKQASRKNRERLTIGMFIDWIDDQYQLDLLYGITDLAKEREVNLLCFEGGVIQARNEFEARRNKVYDLVSPENVDGLIILSAIIGQSLNTESLHQFCKHYRPLPIVLVGLAIPGIPSVLVDNSGLTELMYHLINVHRYKRFAFIKGAESSLDAFQRYEIFLKTLAEYRIPIDEQLIVQGDYTFESGEAAIRVLLDERRASFDVVIACNDDMAAGALNELKRRGVKVPGEIAVVGFDNLVLSRMTSPPLTTVGYSIYELGRRAAAILIDHLNNKTIPLVEKVNTRLIIRNSCGCDDSQNTSGDEKIRPEFSSGAVTGQIDYTALITEIVQKINYRFPDLKSINIEAVTAGLLSAFESELHGLAEDAFTKAWSKILETASRMYRDISLWHTLLSELRHNLVPYLVDHEMLYRAEDLFQKARMIICEKVFKMELYTHEETTQINNSLSYLREQLLATVDENKAMDLLARTLPGLGIKSCYIVIFEGKTQQKSRVILGYDEHGRLDHGRQQFFSQKLLPGSLLTNKRRATILVVALNTFKPQLGYTLFEMGLHDGRTYSELRRIICSTIQVAVFFKKIREQASRLRTQKEHLSNNINQLRKVMAGFIQAIALTVESRDPYTAGHQHRVAELACAIATEMKLPPDKIESIQMAGIVHDLGKIYIPAEILNKPGHLKELEFNFIKNHPQIAYDILEKIEFPWPIDQIILQHHERIDGSGYPFGLKGEDIKLEARILMVADVVEAMISHRPYRTAFSLAKALEEIEAKRDLLYDTDVVEECLKLFRQKGFQFKN